MRAFLKEHLPEYLVPSVFVPIAAIPVTAHGKLDAAALPRPETGRRDDEIPFVAPRTPVEETLAGIWAGVLNVERVGATDNFFELGGHSLVATRVVARARDAFGIELPVRAIFDAPVLGALAVEITALQAENDDDIAGLLDELRSAE
jgi:acyl carrier protein